MYIYIYILITSRRLLPSSFAHPGALSLLSLLFSVVVCSFSFILNVLFHPNASCAGSFVSVILSFGAWFLNY